MARVGALVIAVALLCATVPSAAGAQETFTARLSWVPISGLEREDVAGRGVATAALVGARLRISGTFEGLPAAARAARLHEGVARGARGPAIAELSITPAVSGTLHGEVALTPAQLEALGAGRLYVQVHSARGVAPDNANLWGWFLK